MIKNKRGFTMIEFIIVLLISSVLIVILSISRRSQIKSTYFREADVLIADIVNKENLAYMAANISTFFNVPLSSYALVGGLEVVDGRKYLYFNSFQVTNADSSSFIVTVYGNEDSIAKGVVRKVRYQDGDIIPILN
ncbi:MAG: prepilin-type N-terminal cleavage/methylation domain-containing protein [Endomicrobium sp.]|jgi:prepilin-type N-terminal cleavage/methylation domain-containing protein|nr:prepilin-type N-terminal cleavage/methylation domain-containing protein [Endomicrobium sp.]